MEGCLFFWFFIFVGLGFNVVRWLINVRDVEKGKRIFSLLTLAVIVVPLSLIGGIVVYVLAQASPVIQGNVDDPHRLRLWRFWVQWHMLLFFCSSLLSMLFLFWTLASFLQKDWRIKSFTLFFALITSLLTTMILSISAPTA